MGQVLARQAPRVGDVADADEAEGRIGGFRRLIAVRALGGDAADVGAGQFRGSAFIGAGLQVGDALFEEANDGFGAVRAADHLAHDAQGLEELGPRPAEIAILENHHRNAGLLLKLDRIVAHGAVGLENDLGLGRQGQDQFRIVVAAELAEGRQVLELRVGQGIGPGVELVAPRLDVVDGDRHVLGLEIGQQAQRTGTGTDDTRYGFRNFDRTAHRVGHVAGLGGRG